MKRFANLCRFSRENGFEGGVYIEDNDWIGFQLFDPNLLRKCIKVLPKDADPVTYDNVPRNIAFSDDIDVARFLKSLPLQFSPRVQSSKSYRMLRDRRGTYDVVHLDGEKISKVEYARHMLTKHVLYQDVLSIGKEYPPTKLEQEDIIDSFPNILSDLLVFAFARTIWRSSDGSSIPLWAVASAPVRDCPITIYSGLGGSQFETSKW